ncbi:MAG: FMN-binding protein [Calditrichaeota bacterium]|nr:FMN-binding protein [Calditrichota bacterium]
MHMHGAGHHHPSAGEGGDDVSSFRMILTMGTIGLLAGLLIVVTYRLTLPIIEQNKAEFLQRAIFDVLPNASQKQAFVVEKDGTLRPERGKEKRVFKIYAGYDDRGKLVGVAIEAKGQGFQDVIHIIYGYDPEREVIVGMKVLESKETPGLGSKIETDPEFIANFKALVVKLTPDLSDLVHPLEMVKKGQKTADWQIEAITGATISSRAITNILLKSSREILPIIQRNLDVLKQGASQ